MRTIELEEARRLVAEGGNLPRARRMELQQERLHELVAYVRSHSPYFARHYADVPADFSLASLPPLKGSITQTGMPISPRISTFSLPCWKVQSR